MLHRQTNWRRAEDDTPKWLKDNNSILFFDDDLAGVQLPHGDLVVISAVMANYDVRCILIDNGSLADILLYDVFSRMCFPKNKLQRFPMSLTEFGGNQVDVEGKIVLPMTLEIEPRQKMLLINFIVVWTPSAYNMTLGRPSLNKFWAIVSTYYLLVHFPT